MIAKRKKTDKDFAKDYEEDFENFKTNKDFTERAERGNWKKHGKFWRKPVIPKRKITTNFNPVLVEAKGKLLK